MSTRGLCSGRRAKLAASGDRSRPAVLASSRGLARLETKTWRPVAFPIPTGAGMRKAPAPATASADPGAFLLSSNLDLSTSAHEHNTLDRLARGRLR